MCSFKHNISHEIVDAHQATFVERRQIPSYVMALLSLRRLSATVRKSVCIAIIVLLIRKCNVYGLQLGILPVMEMRKEEREQKTCHPERKDQIRILRPPRNAIKKRLVRNASDKPQNTLYLCQRQVSTKTCLRIQIIAAAVTNVMVVNDEGCLWP